MRIKFLIVGANKKEEIEKTEINIMLLNEIGMVSMDSCSHLFRAALKKWGHIETEQEQPLKNSQWPMRT